MPARGPARRPSGASHHKAQQSAPLPRAWSILKNRAEAEEAVQDGYLKAFTAIQGFSGRSSLSTWLTRIVVNEALARRRTVARGARLLEAQAVTDIADYREKVMDGPERPRTPEAEIMRGQIARLLERAIADLPDNYRTVFVLREVEGLSVEETAEALDIPKATVKTRALRARPFAGEARPGFARGAQRRVPLRRRRLRRAHRTRADSLPRADE